MTSTGRRLLLGDAPLLRIGKAPKRMLVYRAEQPFSGMNRAPLEILGRGRQFVAFAVHPDTGKPYEWPEESPLEVAFESLPAITEDAARAWLNAAAEILPPKFARLQRKRPTKRGLRLHLR